MFFCPEVFLFPQGEQPPPPPPPPSGPGPPYFRCFTVTLTHSYTHTHTPQSLGILRTNGQPDAETSTWQHTTLTRDRQPCPRRDSNPQSQRKRATADPHCRPCCHRDRLCYYITASICTKPPSVLFFLISHDPVYVGLWKCRTIITP